MTTKYSKEVTDRSRSAQSVLYNLKMKGPRLSAQLTELASPLFYNQQLIPRKVQLDEPVELPNFDLQLEFLERAVRSALGDLVSRDEDLYDLNRKQSKLADDRRDAVQGVFQMIIRLRRMVLAEFVAPRLDLLSLESPTSREGVVLLRQARNAARILASPDVGDYLGERAMEPSFDPARRAKEVGAVVQRLTGIVNAIKETEQVVDQTRDARNKAMGAYDQTFTRSARILEDYFLMTGDKEMARRVRPSITRPGQTEEENPNVPPDSDDPIAAVVAAGESGGDGEPDDGESDDGEPDDGEPDDGEPDDGESDDGEEGAST